MVYAGKMNCVTCTWNEKRTFGKQTDARAATVRESELRYINYKGMSDTKFWRNIL